jgi:hypothetical protein
MPEVENWEAKGGKRSLEIDYEHHGMLPAFSLACERTLRHLAWLCISFGVPLYRISVSVQKLRDLCAALDGFALPRAILNFEEGSFVAWNPKFLEQIGLSAEEIKTAQLEDVLTVGESWSPLPNDSHSQRAEYAGCAVKRPFGEPPLPGFIVRTHNKIGYLMLDVFNSSSVQFEQGRLFGREEERNRLNKAFHDEVSSSIVAALFLIERGPQPATFQRWTASPGKLENRYEINGHALLG